MTRKIFIINIKTKTENIIKKYPNAVIIDVTSKADEPWRKFSPFYNHQKIPVPGMPDCWAVSVEGIWQGLKVFTHFDYDVRYFNKFDKGIKRTVKTFGSVKGHFYQNQLLDIATARRLIFLPAYHYILDHYLQKEISLLLDILKSKDLVLLDFTTNEILENPKSPLSHAGVLKQYLLQKSGGLKKELNEQLTLF